VRRFAVISLSVLALLSLYSGFAASLTLQWDPSSDPNVVIYQVYYGTASEAYSDIVAAGPDTHVTIDGLTEGVAYYFAATGLDSAGLESDFSGEMIYQVPGGGCVMTISGLEQLYDGTPKAVSVTTDPPDLRYQLTYSGLTDPPTEAGYYAVTAVSRDERCASQATEILTIDPTSATVQLANLEQAYDGTARAATVLTDPPGLAVSVTYDGSLDPPTNSGIYVVNATIVDPNYTGGASEFLIVDRAQAPVYLAALDQAYNGAPPQVWTLTSPPGLKLDLMYNGLPDPPTDAGTYQVDATIDDPNAFGSNSVTLVIEKAQLPVHLGNLNQVYDGRPKPVSATTSGINAAVEITYNGYEAPPTEAGSYAVDARVVNEQNYEGETAGTLVIAKARATVNFDNSVQTADGTPKSVSVTTAPPGLYVMLKYLKQPNTPSTPGTYAVNGIVYDPNYDGSATTTLTILPSTRAPAAMTDLEPSSHPLRLSWSGAPSGVTVWYSTNLTSWAAFTNFAESSGSFVIRSSSEFRFFKVTSAEARGTNRIPILSRLWAE
jgi:hypothetical protein